MEEEKNKWRDALQWLLDCLKEKFNKECTTSFLEALSAGKNLCEAWGLSIEKRKICRKRMPGENAVCNTYCKEESLLPKVELG